LLLFYFFCIEIIKKAAQAEIDEQKEL